MIAGEQIKAARKLLGWTRSRLAARSGVSEGTVKTFEGGKRPRERLVLKIRRALEHAGIEFTDEGPAAAARIPTGPTRAITDDHPETG